MSRTTRKTPLKTTMTVQGMNTDELVEAMPRLFSELSQRTDLAQADMITDWTRQWVSVWRTRDVDAAAALATDDVIYEDPTLFGEHIAGKDQFRAFLTAFWQGFPDADFQICGPPHLALLGTGMAFPWRLTGTFAGDLSADRFPLALAPTGRRVAFSGVDLYEFRDGLLSRWISVFDIVGFGQQIGLMPASDSPMFRAMASMQRLTAPLVRRINGRK